VAYGKVQVATGYDTLKPMFGPGHRSRRPGAYQAGPRTGLGSFNIRTGPAVSIFARVRRIRR